MIIALVAMCGLNSCSEDCDHEFNDVDYSKSIIGIWSSESEAYEEGIRFTEVKETIHQILSDCPSQSPPRSFSHYLGLFP